MKRFSRSPITEHNKYKETDTLYDPLRETLRKTSASKIKVTTQNVSVVTQLKGSAVSKEVHQFTPEQAQRLEHQILIPSNRKLRPTGEHYLIEGKKFVAVDVMQKHGQPLSQEQFRALYREGVLDERIYQISSKSTSQKQSGRETPLPTPQIQVSQKLQQNRFTNKTQYQTNSGLNINEQQLNSRLSNGISLHKQQGKTSALVPDFRQSQKYYFQTNGQDGQTPQVKFAPEGLGKVRQSGIRNTLVASKSEKAESGLDIGIRKVQSNSIQGQKESEKVMKENDSVDINGLDKKKSKEQTQKSIDFNKIVGVQGKTGADNEGQYRFRSGTYASKGMTSEGQKGISTMKKNKSPYKYNLFSAIDEGVNTKCSSFGKNEVIAREINNKKWQ